MNILDKWLTALYKTIWKPRNKAVFEAHTTSNKTSRKSRIQTKKIVDKIKNKRKPKPTNKRKKIHQTKSNQRKRNKTLTPNSIIKRKKSNIQNSPNKRSRRDILLKEP